MQSLEYICPFTHKNMLHTWKQEGEAPASQFELINSKLWHNVHFLPRLRLDLKLSDLSVCRPDPTSINRDECVSPHATRYASSLETLLCDLVMQENTGNSNSLMCNICFSEHSTYKAIDDNQDTIRARFQKHLVMIHCNVSTKKQRSKQNTTDNNHLCKIIQSLEGFISHIILNCI